MTIMGVWIMDWNLKQ